MASLTSTFEIRGKIPSKKNRLIASRGRLIHPKEITDWKRDTFYEIKAQNVPEHFGPVMVDISLFTKQRNDIDNLATTVLDAMQHAGVFKNDNQVAKLVVEKFITKNLTIARITVSERT